MTTRFLLSGLPDSTSRSCSSFPAFTEPYSPLPSVRIRLNLNRIALQPLRIYPHFLSPINPSKMCARTKNSYGCGHTHKQDRSCRHEFCPGLERYHFKHEGDCRPCKRGGEMVLRGLEGQGRYARDLHKKDAGNREPLLTISPDSPTNPWAPPSKKEKDWRSSIRKRADEAWQDEHARREKDLQSRSPSSRHGSVTSAELDSVPSPQSRVDRERAIHEELRKIQDAERIRIHRRRERKASCDSCDSLGESNRSYESGLRSHGYHSHSSGHGSHESDRSRMYDPGLSPPTRQGQNPYNMYNTGFYLSNLGQGLGEFVKDSSWWYGRR